MVGLGADILSIMRLAAQRRAKAAPSVGVFRPTVPRAATALRTLFQRRVAPATQYVTVTPPILVAQPGWTPPVISTGGPVGATTPLATGAAEQMAVDAADDAAAKDEGAVKTAGLPGGPIGALLVLGLVLAFVGRKRR
jgi:hypothetical protein